MEDPPKLKFKTDDIRIPPPPLPAGFLPTDKSWDPEENLTISWFAWEPY